MSSPIPGVERGGMVSGKAVVDYGHGGTPAHDLGRVAGQACTDPRRRASRVEVMGSSRPGIGDTIRAGEFLMGYVNHLTELSGQRCTPPLAWMSQTAVAVLVAADHDLVIAGDPVPGCLLGSRGQMADEVSWRRSPAEVITRTAPRERFVPGGNG